MTDGFTNQLDGPPAPPPETEVSPEVEEMQAANDAALLKRREALEAADEAIHKTTLTFGGELEADHLQEAFDCLLLDEQANEEMV